MQNPPGSTVTFLFTDIEGSTVRWEHHREQMKSAVERHDAILRGAIEVNGGVVFRMEGDAFRAAFDTAVPALLTAVQAQRALEAEPWLPEIAPLRVRMALHTGEAEVRGGDYVGPSLNRMARLLAVAHGGQTLLSLPTEQLVRDNLPPGVTLKDMGEHRLKDLVRPERVFQLAAPGLPSEFPPLATVDSRPNNLPVQHTDLVGREKEIAQVADTLKQHSVRLLTLVGPGGIGKTRLAVQAAAEVLEEFPDGVFFVNLAPISDAGLLASAIAQTLGVKETLGQPLEETLKAYLHGREILLLFDNFEQVVEAAPLLNELIEAAPGLKVMVTSRVPLRIRGEKEYQVPPLQLPGPGRLPSLEELSRYEAVRLFVERATDMRPDFRLTSENAQAVAEITARLDGLPLAIELAAARTRLLPPQAILARLENRLRLLTGGARDLPARQQTLRNTIEWSYDLLDEEEKMLFRRMAVFVGGAALEAIEAVCTPVVSGQWPAASNQRSGQMPAPDPQPLTPLDMDVLDGVQSLVDKSLLRAHQVEGDEAAGAEGEPRFVMLGTIQEYATDRLQESGEAEGLRRRHALYFVQLAEKAEAELLRSSSDEWLRRLDEERGNLRAALQWAIEQGPAPGNGEGSQARYDGVERAQIGLRLVGALGWYWYFRGSMKEGRQWSEVALALPGRTAAEDLFSTREYANALAGAGLLAWLGADFEPARLYGERGLQIAREVGDRALTARLLRLLAMIADFAQGDTALAESLYEESLAIQREVGNKYEVAVQLSQLAWIDVSERRFVRARSRLEEALAISRELGDKGLIAICMARIGRVDYYEGDYPAAVDRYQKCLEISREMGFALFIVGPLNYLGYASLRMGNYSEAIVYFREGLIRGREVGFSWATVRCLAGLAAVAGETGNGERAARLFAISEKLRAATGMAWEDIERVELDRDVATARALVDEKTWQKAWDEGTATSMEQAMEYALEGSAGTTDQSSE